MFLFLLNSIRFYSSVVPRPDIILLVKYLLDKHGTYMYIERLHELTRSTCLQGTTIKERKAVKTVCSKKGQGIDPFTIPCPPQPAHTTTTTIPCG